MNRFYFLFAAMVGVALTSCSGDELAKSATPTVDANASGSITFGGGTTAITRGDLYGSAAATKLNNKFVVYGIKHNVISGGAVQAEDNTATYDNVVYNNFQVAWTANTAGTTASNSSDWDYVGLQAYDATPTSQSIKYWDYSADEGYTFYAFSAKPADMNFPKGGSDNVQVTKVTTDGSSLYNKGYSVAIKPGASLNDLYFSDRVEVPETNYGKTVSFTFRNIGAKVRFGFYETIPGYTVTIDNFYIDGANTAVVTDFATMNDAQNDGFYASLQNVKTSADQTINVTYYESTTATQVINRPKVSNPTGGYDYNIKIGDGTGIINTVLGTSASSPTWADGSASGDYTPVFPFEGNSNPLLLKLDFTLTSEDGNNDVIKVRGARAIVPAKYVQWKGNFAYTYLFKISDMTNGTTGAVDGNDDPTDPEGLKPITFDAIVVDVDNEKQETITSVASNSITTYAEGAIVNEYNNGKKIYVVVSKNDDTSGPNYYNVITPSAIGDDATEAQVYKLSAAATEAEVLANLNGSPTTVTLTATTGGEAATIGTTIPLVDGTTPSIANVYFTPSAAGYYAYVYTRTKYIAPTYAAASGTYDSSKTYYLQNAAGTYYAVSVPNADAYNDNVAKLWTRTDEGTVGVYDVKVIKVQ